MEPEVLVEEWLPVANIQAIVEKEKTLWDFWVKKMIL